jgi:hypothetical protein
MYQVSEFSKYKLSLDQQLNRMWFANVVSPGSSAEGASKPLEPGREALMQVSRKATIPFILHITY